MRTSLLLGVAGLLLGTSAYFTLLLMDTYTSAVMGKLEGPGGAQWQFQFFIAPLPALLGVAALAVSHFVKRPLKVSLRVLSAFAAAVPAVLFLLVLFHVY